MIVALRKKYLLQTFYHTCAVSAVVWILFFVYSEQSSPACNCTCKFPLSDFSIDHHQQQQQVPGPLSDQSMDNEKNSSSIIISCEDSASGVKINRFMEEGDTHLYVILRDSEKS